MKILLIYDLIYEMIPEETKIYVFENVNPNSELVENLLKANGHYTNFDGANEGNAFIDEFLLNKKPIPVSSLPHIHDIDMVIHSGFGL